VDDGDVDAGDASTPLVDAAASPPVASVVEPALEHAATGSGAPNASAMPSSIRG
jgi:hypothetical protein